MSNGKGNALAIIALIIGASGMGIGAFSLIRFQIVTGPEGPSGDDGADGVDGVNGTDGSDGLDGATGDIYAIWKNVSGDGTNFYLQMSEIAVNRTTSIRLVNNNDTLWIDEAGWYRFTFRYTIINMVIGSYYFIDLYKNGINSDDLDLRYAYNSVDTIHFTAYVSSDGNDYFRFRAMTSSINPFLVSQASAYSNQVVLERICDL